MAIATNDAVEKFGTPDDVASSSAAVANAAFSVAGDTADWTNDDDAAFASAILEADWTTAPTANTTVDLFAQLKSMGGAAADGEVPDANFQHQYLGTFPVNDQSTTRQHINIEIGLPNTETSQIYRFFIRNNSGQQIDSGWQLWINPKAIGPK